MTAAIAISSPTRSENFRTEAGGQLAAGRLVAYALLAIPLMLADVPMLTFLPAFYARERALGVAAIGTLFLVARVWDGTLDLLVGWLSDRTRVFSGRRRVWVVVGAPGLMLGAWFLCNPPPDAGFGYMTFWIIVFYTAFTLIKIPYWSWGADLASGYDQRSRVARYRETGTMIAVLLIGLVPMLMMGGNPPLGHVLRLISLGIISLLPPSVVALLIFLPDQPATGVGKPVGLHETVAGVCANGPMMRFLGAACAIYMSIGACNALAVFLIDIGLGLPGGIFLVALVQYVAALAVTPFIGWSGRYIDKHRQLMVGLLLQIAALSIAALVPHPASKLYAIFLFGLIGIGSSCIFVLPLSIIADASDYGALTANEHHSGGYVAAFNLTIKIGAALGLGLAFWLMALMGFRPAEVQPGTVIANNFRIAGFGLSAGLLVPAVLFLLRYPITRTVHQAISTQLAARLSSNHLTQYPSGAADE